MYNGLKFKQNDHELESGINCLEVPRSWPTLEEYDEDVDYGLDDPKQLDQNDPDQWRTVTCPADIEYYLKLRN